MDQKLKKTLQKALETVGGIVGFVVLMWIPKTGGGLLVYVVLFVILVAIALMIGLSRRDSSHDS